jgi:Holliday junction resolvase RusA-like endonuclease
VKVAFTILGQPCSKANSRELATIGPKDKRRTIVRKSDAGLAYERDALAQIPPKCRLQLTGPVRVTLHLFYASERPDLDESIVLDVLGDRYAKHGIGGGEKKLVQKGVYKNDRQVREKHVYHGIDRVNPRAEIEVEAMNAQQVSLPQELFEEAEVPF